MAGQALEALGSLAAKQEDSRQEISRETTSSVQAEFGAAPSALRRNATRVELRIAVAKNHLPISKETP